MRHIFPILLFAMIVGISAIIFYNNVSYARTGDNINYWAIWEEIGELDNCNDAAINSAVICGDTYGFRTEGLNVLTLEIKYTQDAGTGWEFYIESCNEGHGSTDCTNATDWHSVTVDNVVSSVGVGLTVDPIYHDTAASDQIVWSIPINYKRIRLNDFVARGSPTANDKITVYARLGWLPAM